MLKQDEVRNIKMTEASETLNQFQKIVIGSYFGSITNEKEWRNRKQNLHLKMNQTRNKMKECYMKMEDRPFPNSPSPPLMYKNSTFSE